MVRCGVCVAYLFVGALIHVSVFGWAWGMGEVGVGWGWYRPGLALRRFWVGVGVV